MDANTYDGFLFQNSGVVCQFAQATGGADVTAPTVSTLSPADNASDIAIGANLVVTFSEAIAVGTGNITIKNLTDVSEVTIAITAGSPQIVVSGSTLTINPTSDLVAGKSYAIQIAATCIDDLAGNSFAGILNDTTWNFATAAAGGLPTAALLFDLDASAMSGSNDATITQFTDSSAASNHAVTSGSPIVTPKFHNTEGPAGGKCIKFANGVTITDAALTDTSTTVTMASTAGILAGMTVSGTGIQAETTVDSVTNGTTIELSLAAEATADPETLYIATPADATLLTLTDDAPVTNFHLFIHAKGARDGVLLSNNLVSNIFCSLSNDGANKFYVMEAGGVKDFLSAAAAVNYTSTYSVIEVVRSGSTITVKQDGSALGSGTATGTMDGTMTAARIGYALTGNIARMVMYSAVQAGADLTAIHTEFGL